MRGAHSGPTARTLDVLELLATEPEGIRYVDIARKLKLNQGTAHSILKTLVDRNWARRDSINKSFTLGPMATQIGGGAAQAPTTFMELNNAAQELALQLGYATTVIELKNEELVVAASFAGSQATANPEIGTTVPYSPPYGAIFACSAPEVEQSQWLARASSKSSKVKKALKRTLDLAMSRGFDLDWTNQTMAQVSAMSSCLAQMHPAMALAMDQILLEHANLSLAETNPNRSVTSIIAARTSTSQSQSRFGIAVHPFKTLSSDEIERIGQLLVRKVT